jgi:D-alanyl-D-alanine carboxypeptidase/D-alanyl-D-alanine-endopeptidase (penicillin-binding protein 4)
VDTLACVRAKGLRVAGAIAALWALGAAGTQAQASISRTTLQRGLAAQMRSVGGASGAWVYDVDAASNRTLFTWSASARRILASNTKLFTTAALLGRYRPGERLETKVWARGRRAGRSRGKLLGSLALVGAGDPALGSASWARRHDTPLTPLRALAGDVKRSGIRVVRGGILADETVFDSRRGVPTTGVNESGELTPLSGLAYDSSHVDGHPASNPAKVAGQAFKRGLEKAGVRVRGRVRVHDTPDHIRQREPLGVVHSPPVSSLIAETNMPSNNFYAEMLLKRIAAHPDGGGTTARGTQIAESYAASLGSGVSMENGSGLSRADLASPLEVGRLLANMLDTRGGRAFRHSLPKAGEQGTVRHRMNGTAADGRCRTKTGTLIGVSALSGYCRAGHGTVAFSTLFNGVDVTAAQHAEDKIAALIAQYRP